ncbi:hypothetical protein CIG75_06080 [Tumebacillus algifaecis]|uniref:Big-1 domain-containing protein n=1 Tax=Tumebacillus algifaecis TaxID=1214604 RepID=A0A223CYV8_9BACL|nr:hypothetical protein [Tumebacillus algifaecis]ASS74599.1 hypothetical protein CIG75_06080 [Tumebacillus algifaecis]
MKKSMIWMATLTLAVSTMAGAGAVDAKTASAAQAQSTISTTTTIVLNDWYVPSGQNLIGKVVVKDANNQPVVGAPVTVKLIDSWRVERNRRVGTTNSLGELSFTLSTPDFGYYDVIAVTSSFASYTGSTGYSSAEFAY